MLWGCFLYDKKGPCHIWEDETKAERAQADKWLEEQNKALDPVCKADWELETAMRRVGIRRRMPGKPPIQKWKKKTVKLVRDSNGGRWIDWHRYYRCVLEPKLLPFAKECLIKRPGALVQEDNAAPHAHQYQQRVFDLWGVTWLIHCPNSPDLTAAEPPWFYMKRDTTNHGTETSKKQMKEDWIKCQESIPQERFQRRIERIPVHI